VTESYPFVTTGGGGGALPLPTWALAATLRRASTAAVARASFFMKQTLHFATSTQHTSEASMPLVLKRHTYNFFALAGRDTEQLPFSSAKTCAGNEIEIFRGLADMISVGT
jgi:hypothetical protein